MLFHCSLSYNRHLPYQPTHIQSPVYMLKLADIHLIGIWTVAKYTLLVCGLALTEFNWDFTTQSLRANVCLIIIPTYLKYLTRPTYVFHTPYYVIYKLLVIFIEIYLYTWILTLSHKYYVNNNGETWGNPIHNTVVL